MSRAEAWGVALGYHRTDGAWHEPPPETVDAILDSMGAGRADAPAADGPRFARPGDWVGERTVLTLEDGGEIGVEGALPPDLPFGYHRLGERALIVSPGRCVLPARREWGWAVQLYAARSRASWGIGDLADLRRLAEWSAREQGAGLVLVNPLHAAVPGVPQQASPYFPSSRRFRNPLYLRVEEVPGAEAIDDLGELAAAGHALNDDRRIDRDAVYKHKLAALEQVYERFRGDPALDEYCRREGPSLEGYATFCTIAEDQGCPWPQWPAPLRRPGSSAVAGYRDAYSSRVRFHMWLQWLLDVQLEGAGRGGAAIVHDLAVGVDPGGADAWLWNDVIVGEMAVGAPPDEFNTQGQDWGVPPFDPWKLRAAGYGPFIETIRSALRHAGGIRLDHVMGLFRLFWVPRGTSAKHGTYVRYPASDLLDIVALESHRAGAYVVGEDLGTVEDAVRHELWERDVLSYRLLWFERESPERWPVKALAAVTTHDLPTIAGLWSGRDVEAQRSVGAQPNEDALAATRAHLQAVSGVASPDAPVEDVVAGAHRALGRAACMLVTAALDDALAVEERPNMPGTLDEWPNWSIALPAPLEEIERHPGAQAVAEALRR